MDTKIEQLKEDNNEDEYYSGASKKRRNNSHPISYKILIFITIISCLISLYLIYSSYTKKSSRSFLEFAESRFSVRKFSEKPVEQEKIDALLKAVQIAPTAENKQPQKIYIITKEEDRKKLKSVTKYAFNAPMYFLVCCDKNKAWKHETEDYYSTEIDGTISITHIILEAHDLGLGSVVVRSFETENMRKLFGIPENMIPIALLPIGYPKEGVKPSKWHIQKKDVKELAEYL